MQELNLYGVFVPAPLVWAIAAFFLSSGAARLFNWLDVYRFVWHRALFDFAVFVIIWAAISAVPYYAAFSNAGLR